MFRSGEVLAQTPNGLDSTRRQWAIVVGEGSVVPSRLGVADEQQVRRMSVSSHVVERLWPAGSSAVANRRDQPIPLEVVWLNERPGPFRSLTSVLRHHRSRSGSSLAGRSETDRSAQPISLVTN